MTQDAAEKWADNKQKALIHMMAGSLGLDDAAYRSLIAAQCGGKRSAAELTYAEAERLIDYCVRVLGFKIKRRPVNICRLLCAPRASRLPLPENVIKLASVWQMDEIERLRALVRWQYEDGYERWLRKFVKVSVIKLSPQASRAIEGLKGIIKSQNKCACALAKKAS
jgi:hypothetical protein